MKPMAPHGLLALMRSCLRFFDADLHRKRTGQAPESYAKLLRIKVRHNMDPCVTTADP